jgi:hypothetical protein
MSRKQNAINKVLITSFFLSALTPSLVYFCTGTLFFTGIACYTYIAPQILEDAGIKSRTVAEFAMTVRASNLLYF